MTTSHKKTIAIAAIATIIGFGAIYITGDHLASSVVGSINTSTYQAVHLDNGDSYFGKVTTVNDDFVTITDVFYFLDESKKTLVKRGDESLTLNRTHVLATENLETDSAILRAILNYKNKN